jgi:hypothetical protein
LASFLIGALLTLLVARLYPFPEAPPIPSDASALANGGREEAFYIRLPGDRLGSPRAAAVAAFPEQKFVRQSNDRIIAELFRIRNSSGRIIGLASRMSGPVAASEDRAMRNTDWIVMLPGRGSLMMSSAGHPVDQGRRYPSNRMGLDPAKSGLILHGTDQFSDLNGFFIEEVEVDSVDDDGQVRGVLTLITRMQGGA